MGKKSKKPKETRKQSAPTEEPARHSATGERIKDLVNHKALVVVLLFVISFAVFVPSLKNNFVWDDRVAIQKNYHAFRNFNIKSLLIPKEKENKSIGYYRPVVFSSMFVDRTIWGPSPFGFHLSNLIFHSVSTVLFYLLVFLLLGEFKVERKEGIAFLSSLFFAFHPMHVESVSWIAGRTDVLCGLFFSLAFIFYILSYRKLWFLSLSAISVFLALLSKEVAIAFPIAAFGFDIATGRYKSRANVLKYAICGTLVFAYLYLRGRAFIIIPELTGERIQQAASQGPQIWGVLKVVLNSYLFYIKELVFPFSFNAFIGTVPGGGSYLVSSVLVILLLCVISLVSIKKKEGVTAFCIFWILITIVPSCIIAISRFAATPLAERYLYIPSAGYCLLVGYLLLQLGNRIKAQKISWLMGFLIIIAYLFFTIERQGVWKDNLSFWEDASKRSPHQFITHLNYGVALKEAGRKDEAIREFQTAIENDTIRSSKRGKAKTANSIGITYLEKGDPGNAENWFRKAIDFDPKFGGSYYQVGFIYFIKGDPINAENWFRKAIDFDPNNAKAYYHLGAIYYIKGEHEKSIASYKIAEENLKRALTLSRHSGKAHFVLAKVYIGLGERQKAKEHAKEAIQNGLEGQLYQEAENILKNN
jgi:tetratricopeptide (TPR) repeat protein